MAKTGDYGIKYIENDDSVDIVTDMNGNFEAVSYELDNLNDKIGDCASAQHNHNLSSSDITGVLPVNKGGTGANNLKQLKKNLGIQKHCYIAAAGNSDSNLKDYADFIIEGEKDFQNVIDSVPSGSVIRFLAGNYYLYSSSLKIGKQLIFEGSGHQTVIHANALNNQPVFKLGTDDIEKPTSNITIRDIYISHRDTGYDGARNLIEAGNINGLYIYRVGFNFNITNRVMQGSSIIKCSGYMRNVHIHDCVINSNIPDNSKERYCFNFKDIDATKKAEFCAYISNTSYLNNTEFSVNLLDTDMKNKIALTGILGGYKLYVNKQEVAQ